MSRKSEAAKILQRIDNRAAKVVTDRDATGTVSRAEFKRLCQLVLDMHRFIMLSSRTDPADLTDPNV